MCAAAALENGSVVMHSLGGMKRFIGIFFCLSVIFAGAVSVWADCKKFSFHADDHNNSPRALPAHENHSESQHDHSHGTVIHCATLDEFVLTSVFSLPKDKGVYRAPNSIVVVLNSQWIQHVSGWLTHGPPGLPRSRTISPYLLLSVLRI